MTLQEQIIELVAKELRMKPELVFPDSDLLRDLGTDSLDAVELITALEDTFKIEFADKDHERIQTVQDIIDLVQQLRNKAL